MCRFLAYHGDPIILHRVLYEPANSLISQSQHARESHTALNGDGFGLGWYAPDVGPIPAVFSSIRPAWNDRNLLYMTPNIRSHNFFAHVRAASMGGVSEFNCHPFHYNQFLFMHNGTLKGFEKLKRHIRRVLPDDIYDWIKGQTDSEHFFARCIHNFKQRYTEATPENMAEVFEITINQMRELQREYGIDEITLLNCVVTDGRNMVAVRYTSDPSDSNTLYYSDILEKEKIRDSQGNPGKKGAVLLASEKLTDYDLAWHEVPINHLWMLTDDLKVTMRPLQLS